MRLGERLPGTPEPMHYWPGSDNVRLAGDSWGNPNNTLVILLHGGGQTRHAWKHTGELLGQAGYYAVAVDARGHGDSDWATDGAYGPDHNVRDLQSLISALGGRNPILIGASMGGITSMVGIGEGHIDADALVLVDIAPRVEANGVDRIQAFMTQKPEGFDSLEEVADAIASYQPNRERPKNLRGLAKNIRLAPNGKYRWHWDPRMRPPKRDLIARQVRLEACARNLKIPVLLVRGGMSDVLTEQGAREFQALVPSSEFVNIGSAGHMVAGDRNDSFGQAAIEFLTRKIPASQSDK